MAAQRANFPITGPRAKNHQDARRLTRRAQDSLDDRNAQKRAAALKDPGADRNAENVARAKREGWTKTGGPTHTPAQ